MELDIVMELVFLVLLIFLFIWSMVVSTDEYRAKDSEKIINKIVWIGFVGLLYVWITERLIS